MIASRLAAIRSEITQLSTRSVELVAVSKTKPIEALVEAYAAGQRHFGENYVAEILDKYNKLPEDTLWHFIGHLQSNKVSKLLMNCPNLYMVETVDSVKLASKLDNVLSTASRSSKLRVLVELKTSDEDTKSGASLADALQLIMHIINRCPNLYFSGVMTIADPVNPERSFKALISFVDKLKEASVSVEVISMGMSGDYPLAIHFGSTEVRIGSSIFGSR